jgi:hypothetical protein
MEFVQLIIYFIVVTVIAAVPFDIFLPWLLSKSREIESQLEKPSSYLYMSKAPFIAALAKAIDFGKGYLIPFCALYFYDDLIMLISVAIVLVAHNWTPVLKFKNRKAFLLVLWGLYSFMFHPFIFIYPIAFIIFSFLINSFFIGLMINIVFMFFCVWFFELPAVYLPINFIVFGIAFVAYVRQLFIHFESDNKFTILKSFKNR